MVIQNHLSGVTPASGLRHEPIHDGYSAVRDHFSKDYVY